MKVLIVSIGKTKELWLQDALAEYEKRLRADLEISYQFVKDDKALLAAVENKSNILCLDPQGTLHDSPSFSAFIMEKLHKGPLTIVIGGPEGLPTTLRRSTPLISFSPMTFTHQCIRLLLIEQLYRALQIYQCKPYHK